MNTKTGARIGICALAAAMILLLLYIGFRIRLKMALNVRTVSIASHDIQPRTRIMADDLLEVEIPAAYLPAGVIMDADRIIGNWTDIQGRIPAGSCFFEGMLTAEADLPDYPSAQLRPGQAAYTLETDLARIGGTLVPGQRVDIFASVDIRDENPLNGRLFAHARVIAIKDHKGLDLTEEDSTGVPYLAIMAIRQEDVPVLATAEKVGEVRLISTSGTYDMTKEAEIIKDTALYSYLIRGIDHENGEHSSSG